MRKLLLFLGFGLLVYVTAFAQSLSLSWTGGSITNDQVITFVGDTGGTTYSYVDCKNESGGTVSVKVKKNPLTVVSGSENTFCWFNCYLPSVYVSVFSIDIQPDSVADDFIGEYKAKGNIGLTSVQYTFFNLIDENDSIAVVVNYDCTLGSSLVENEVKEIRFSNAYPNPAGNLTSFTYTLPSADIPARFIIRDMVGNLVYETQINDQEGTLKVETDGFGDGVYFYSLIVDDSPYMTKKLIVRH